jgi:hypothetical protein
MPLILNSYKQALIVPFIMEETPYILLKGPFYASF